MKRKILSLLLALTLCVGLAIPALAASDEAIAAADRLHELGLFAGVGDNTDGTPNYDLDRAPNRMEAVTLLVRLLGKEAEAKTGTWNTPFTDVADWAKLYVGYAYENGLTSGTSATTFSGTDTVSATQYLTFVLRALGYASDTDFQWDKAWELTDKLGITSGQYSSSSAFTRGDAVIVSARALDIKLKDGSKTLLKVIQENLASTPATGNAGKKFTCTGEGELGTKITTTVDVISANEAVFTMEFPLAISKANQYEVLFRKGNAEISIGHYHDPETSSYFAYSYHSSEDIPGVSFTDTNAQDGKITWRIKLPADCSFNFGMIGEYEMSCIASALYS